MVGIGVIFHELGIVIRSSVTGIRAIEETVQGVETDGRRFLS